MDTLVRMLTYYEFAQSIFNLVLVSIKAILPNDLVPNIVGGPLLDEYTFQSLHFHWGTDDSSGSEHSLNNKKYVMEMHCIHKKRDLTMEAASSMHNGLVVVAYFFDVSSTKAGKLKSKKSYD